MTLFARRLMPVAYDLVRRWYIWRRPARTTVAIAVWHDGRLLLVSHSYKDAVTMPGGGVRRHELPACAAVRELREETGIAAAPEALRLVDVSRYSGQYGERTTFLYELRLMRYPAIRANGWETIGARFADAREIGHMARTELFGDYLTRVLREPAAFAPG